MSTQDKLMIERMGVRTGRIHHKESNITELERFTHFRDIPLELQHKIHDVVNEFDSFEELLYETHGDNEVEKIHGNSYDGYIAFQRGGFRKCVFAQCGTDTSYHVNDAQTEYLNKQYDYMLECMSEEFGFNLDTDNLSDVQREQLYDYENEWFEPQLVSFELYVADNTNTVEIRLNTNYRDQPYYREKYEDCLAHISLSFRLFMHLSIDEIIKRTMDNIGE